MMEPLELPEKEFPQPDTSDGPFTEIRKHSKTW
jgi:hypothetical protein